MASNLNQMGLFEKLLGPVPGSGDNYTVRWVGDPIRQHITLLLNTRRGSVRHLPDYGLPDVSSYYSDYPSSLSYLRSEIVDLITKYEPRLGNVSVRLVDSDHQEFKVSLLIAGEIEEPEGLVRVSYRTTIASNGHADME